MPQDPNCLFCQIANKERPAYTIYEDDNIMAILDINPVSPGHTLIVPKHHSFNMLDASDLMLENMIVATKKVAKAILDSLGYDSFNLELNNGRVAGQIIPHLHWHIVPRAEDDGLKHWPGKQYGEGEADSVLAKIRAQIR